MVKTLNRTLGVSHWTIFCGKKPHSTPNSFITVNWDHARQKYVLSINVLNFLYTVGEGSAAINLPIAYEVVSKTEAYLDKKTGKTKIKRLKNKNEMLRERLKNPERPKPDKIQIHALGHLV